MFYTVEWFPSDINDIRIEAPNNKFTVCLIIIYYIKSKAKHNECQKPQLKGSLKFKISDMVQIVTTFIGMFGMTFIVMFGIIYLIVPSPK